jgi:hypothetical protein
MRRMRLNTLICSLMAAALLLATSQYLTHFHIQAADSVVHADSRADQGHAERAHAEHCSLCLQFDRLPAPPASQALAPPYFFLVATLEAERLERLALASPLLWPPSRGPPALA